MPPCYRLFPAFALVATLAFQAAPIQAASDPRSVLVGAAFTAPDKTAALAQVNAARAGAQAALARDPHDRSARFVAAMALGYHAKLTRDRSEAMTARHAFDAMAQAFPSDPEVWIAIAGWNLDSIADLGGLVARTALGARKAAGLAALDRAVTVGPGRADVLGIAALMRIRLDPHDVARSRALAEKARAAPASTLLARFLQRGAVAMLPALEAGDGKAAAAIAVRALPFGRLR